MIIGFPLGLIVGTVQFFRDNSTKRECSKPPPIVERDENAIEFYKQQIRDLQKLYRYTERELADATTISKQRSCQARLITLDERIFKVQQKINKLQE
jgi:prefoldin subunit 5